MSEQKIQDENGAVTEQNPMVQRISLEVQRREPSSVRDEEIFLPRNDRTFLGRRSKN